METFTCSKECCKIEIHPYITQSEASGRRRRRKAGACIYDPTTKRVLLVQSRGHLWGPPKGTLQYGETERLCAVREVKEETGLEISADNFTRALNISNHAIYFYLEQAETPVSIQSHVPNNDANGISWMKVECLCECVGNGNITLSRHGRLVFQKFLDANFPSDTFTVAKRRAKRVVK